MIENLTTQSVFPMFFFINQVSKTLNPLVTGSFAGMYSLTKNSLILFPTLIVSLAENWDAALIGQLFFAEVDPVYRTIGNSIYLCFRWSF